MLGANTIFQSSRYKCDDLLGSSLGFPGQQLVRRSAGGVRQGVNEPKRQPSVQITRRRFQHEVYLSGIFGFRRRRVDGLHQLDVVSVQARLRSRGLGLRVTDVGDQLIQGGSQPEFSGRTVGVDPSQSLLDGLTVFIDSDNKSVRKHVELPFLGLRRENLTLGPLHLPQPKVLDW